MENTDQNGPTSPVAAVPHEVLNAARGRLSDRNIDPDQVLGRGELGDVMTTASFYVLLGAVAASEKAGQSPTHALARLAVRCGLPNEIADTLFLAYNQQSAEEAGHGDKVFGNAYYAMGGRSHRAEQSIFDTDPTPALSGDDDPRENKKRLGGAAATLGGIETVALSRTFPSIIALCERWDHPIARDLLAQIHDVVRPEESRHVLLWRYVFHHLIVPKGDKVIGYFHQATNFGRQLVAAADLDSETFLRVVGTAAPTPRQLLGKDRVALS